MEIKEDNRFEKGLLFGVVAGILLSLLVVFYLNPDLMRRNRQESIEEEPQQVTQYSSTTNRNKKLDQVQQLIEEKYLFEYDENTFADYSCMGLVAALNDPYSVYYTKEQYNDMMESSTGMYFGIGVMVSQNMKTGEISIIQVFKESPAEEVGLKEEDIVVAVEGELVTGEDINLVVSKIRGYEGERVAIQVYRPDTEEYLDFQVERREVQRDTVEYEMLENGIGYIQLTEFDEVTYDQFMNAFDTLEGQGMKGLILDLRDNPGGLLDVVVDIADEFLPEGTICYTEDKNGEGETYSSREETQINIPLAVLINGDSASASEVFSGAIKDYEWGTLIGTTSFGKGIVQQIFPFRDGSAVKLTISHYFTPNGTDIHGTGITPDIVVEKAEGDVDNQLEAAIANVQEQLSE